MKKNSALTEVHLAALLFGMAGLFGKWLALSPLAIVLGRVVFASAALAVVLAILRQPVFALKVKDLAMFALMGLVLAAHWATFFKSIQVSTVAVGLLAYSTFPFFTAFLEPLLLREKMEKRFVLLSLACLAGVFFIIPRFDMSNAVLQGVLWGLLSGLSFSLLAIFNRRMTRTYSSLRVAFHQDFFAGLFLLPLALSSPPALARRDVLLLAVLGIVCTAGAHTLFIDGMKAVGARAASIISALEPVYGVILALAFLKEVPAPKTLLGGALILAAVAALSLRKTGGLR